MICIREDELSKVVNGLYIRNRIVNLKDWTGLSLHRYGVLFTWALWTRLLPRSQARDTNVKIDLADHFNESSACRAGFLAQT